MSNIRVKPAEIKECKNLAIVQTLSWKCAFCHIFSEEFLNDYTNLQKCEKNLKNIINNSDVEIYIGYLDEIACAELIWKNGKEQEAEIIALHSVPNSWGSGLGQAMMEYALEQIRRRQYQFVGLWVLKDNHRARRFYEKCGFQAEPENRIVRFENAEEIRYRKKLF